MMGENGHKSKLPRTQNQDDGMSRDPGDGDRLTDKPGAIGKAPVGKAPADAHNKAKVEEFSERGMGVAGKE